jgi:hypothetical protein|tara:strand:- start:1185 stop:1466 length:282 start_codon:yes stop_codon:yes gene_type:complete
MKKLTSKKVRDYMSYRASDGLKHCPEAIALACNDMADEYGCTDFAKAAEPLDYLRLLFFNDPIKGMFTHSYGFHTATGRSIIEQLKSRYYEYK